MSPLSGRGGESGFTHGGPGQSGATSHSGSVAAQAGNKSLLSFRSDTGIPGYTGFIPGFAEVPIPLKGNTKHTGRVASVQSKDAVTLRTNDTHKASEYRSTYQADLSAYKPPKKSGGDYWFLSRATAAAEAKRFIASTTYARELCDGQATSAQQLDASQGLTVTIVHSEVARQRRSQSADPRARRQQPLSSTTTRLETGELVGYKSEYQSMTARPSTHDQAQHLSNERPDTAPQMRYTVMPRAFEAPLSGTTTYHQSFGPSGADPMTRCPAHVDPKSLTLSSTARELADGTSRGCHHLPGYTGFVPTSDVNAVARQQGEGDGERADNKVNMLLFNLDQYSRTRMPNYTGYKPKEARNISVVQPAQGPTTATTSGWEAAQVITRARTLAPGVNDKEFAINSRHGIMGFFTGGQESVSDNGETDAQRFYCRLRPLEGRFNTYQASKTQPHGAHFAPTASLVAAKVQTQP